jgi:hypothetical protein
MMKKEEEPNILNKNMKLLVQAYRLQCEKKFEESFKIIQKSWKIMEKLAELADSQPQMQQMLNTNREIIPNSLFLKKFEKNLGINNSLFEDELNFNKDGNDPNLSTDNNVNFINFLANRAPPRKEKQFRTPKTIKKKIIKPGDLITNILRKDQIKKNQRKDRFGLGDNVDTSFILQQRALLLKMKGKKMERNKWTEEELKKLKEGIKIYGKKDVRSLSEFVGSRSVSQIRSKIQKMELKKKQARANS